MSQEADWTKPGSFSAGRDPLGFQATSVRLYTSLVPGLTNVTNRLRYYSFYCWVVWQFEQTHHSKNEDKWVEFIRRAEAAIALACQVGDAASAVGMAGSDWWRNRAADQSQKTFDLIEPTNRPGEDGQYLKAKFGNFGQFYTASMLEMDLLHKLDETPPPRIYGVSENVGKQLAMAVQQENSEACSLLLKAIDSGEISRSACEIVSTSLHPSNLDSGSEEARLLRVFLQGERQDDKTAESRRITLRNVLAVVAEAGNELDLRRGLYVQSTRLRDRDIAIPNLTRWRAYFVNEFCHIALEVWLNALVGLTNMAERPGSIESLAASLTAKVEPERALSTDEFAQKLALHDLEAEHDLGLELLAVASAKKMPEADQIASSAKLILSLWKRWRTDKSVREELAAATVDARSAEGVFRFLDKSQNSDASATILNLIKKFVVSNHLMIAGQKLATGGRFTYRFTLDDDCLVDGQYGEYTYTNPRIFNLLTFAKDARLVDVKSGRLTEAGAEFLHAA